MTSTTNDTNKTCAGEGNGYWHCDVLGGCPDCRKLATHVDDYDQFYTWADDAWDAGNRSMHLARRNTARRLGGLDSAMED